MRPSRKHLVRPLILGTFKCVQFGLPFSMSTWNGLVPADNGEHSFTNRPELFHFLRRVSGIAVFLSLCLSVWLNLHLQVQGCLRLLYA